MTAAVPRGVGPFLAMTDYTWDKCFEMKTAQEVITFVATVCARKEMKTDRTASNIVEKFKLDGKKVLTELIFLTPTAEGTPPHRVLDPIMLALGGVDLPHYTVFDLLGYCIARAVLFDPIVDSGPKAPTAGNFYMPLLSLFCRWSSLLVKEDPPVKKDPSVKKDPDAEKDLLPNMHCVTWVENAKEVPLKIVLGSAIPGVKPFKSAIQEARLVNIIGAAAANGQKLSTKAPTTQDVDPEGKKRKLRKDDFAYPMKVNAAGKFEQQSRQLFGHCSESNQFMWYPFRLRGETSDVIFGLAMNPTKVPNPGAYTFANFAKALRDPCNNCQRMIRVLLGEQGKPASTTKPTPTQPDDDDLLDDYYEQLGKDNIMAAKQKALDKSTSQNVLRFFGIAELKKNKGLPNKKGSIGIASFAPGGKNERRLNASAAVSGGGDGDDDDEAAGDVADSDAPADDDEDASDAAGGSEDDEEADKDDTEGEDASDAAGGNKDGEEADKGDSEGEADEDGEEEEDKGDDEVGPDGKSKTVGKGSDVDEEEDEGEADGEEGEEDDDEGEEGDEEEGSAPVAANKPAVKGSAS